MDASDLIAIKKAKAQWVNYISYVQAQPGCITGGCLSTISTPCVVRYATYEERDIIRVGRAECADCYSYETTCGASCSTISTFVNFLPCYFKGSA